MKTKGFIVIEVGDHEIGVGLFEHAADSGKLRLSDHGTTPIAQDASGSMTREAMVAIALKKVLAEKNLKSHRAILCLNGKSVFSRVVKLPPVAPDRIKQTISHEAVQNIPFPLEEVIWRYHVADPSAIECEVVLVAIKKEIVEGLVYAIKANGLYVERVDASPVILANILRLVHPKLEEPILLVDTGLKSSNLVFVKGKSSYFRTLTVGGERSNDLAQEINRSISFFKSQSGGTGPARIVVCGGGITSRELQHDSGIPSEILDVSAVCADSRNIEPGEGLAVRVGSGLVFSTNPEMLLDFLPSEMHKERRQSDQKPWWMACGVLLLLIIAVWIVGLNKLAQKTKEERIAIESAIVALEEIEQKMIPIETDIQSVETKVQLYTDVIQERRLWLSALSDIRSCLPEGMFLLSSETLKELGELKGLRIEVISYLDKEPENEDVVRLLRDLLRARDLFGSGTQVFSRPSKRQFMRQFTLDVYFSEAVPE